MSYITKKDFIKMVNESESSWELIGRLIAAHGFSRSKEIDEATNDLIKRETEKKY